MAQWRDVIQQGILSLENDAAPPPCPEVIYPEASVSLSSSPRTVWTHTLTIYYNADPRIGGDLHSQILCVITPFPLSPQSPIIGDAHAVHCPVPGRLSCLRKQESRGGTCGQSLNDRAV